jgi:allantoicase
LPAAAPAGTGLRIAPQTQRSPARGAAPGQLGTDSVQIRTGLAAAERRQAFGDTRDGIGIAEDLQGHLQTTSRFVENAPGWAKLADDRTGVPLLPRTPLLPDTEQRFRVRGAGEVSRVRLDIYPDGGLSRLRLNGEVARVARDAVIQRWLSVLPADQAGQVDPAEFFDC